MGRAERAAAAEMRLVWTRAALSDLRDARAYISFDNPSAAATQVEQVLSAAAGLVHFPESGRPGRRTGTRELVVGRTPFVVAYRVRADVVEIVRVLHGRRRWLQTF
jgi:toxin ParE1/3/4